MTSNEIMYRKKIQIIFAFIEFDALLIKLDCKIIGGFIEPTIIFKGNIFFLRFK